MRILLTGGGTLGPVTPLLALATELKKENASIVGFIGTHGGPEKNLVEKSGIKFFAIASGKLRRYFDLRTIFVPFFVLIGFVQSLILLAKLKPTMLAFSFFSSVAKASNGVTGPSVPPPVNNIRINHGYVSIELEKRKEKSEKSTWEMN